MGAVWDVGSRVVGTQLTDINFVLKCYLYGKALDCDIPNGALLGIDASYASNHEVSQRQIEIAALPDGSSRAGCIDL